MNSDSYLWQRAENLNYFISTQQKLDGDMNIMQE